MSIKKNQGIKNEYPHVLEKIQESLRLVEKWSEIIYFIGVKLTPVCGLLPNAFISLYLYYIKDLGNDAFQMSDETMS